MGKTKNIFPDYIPGQMDITSYLNEIGMTDEEKARIRKDTTIYKAPIIWKNSPGIFEEYFGDDFNAD